MGASRSRIAGAVGVLIFLSGCFGAPGDAGPSASDPEPGGPLVELRVLDEQELTPVPWDELIDRTGTGISFGVKLHGPSPYTRNPDRPFIPASNSKLFTAAAALSLLGPDFRYETEIRWTPARNGAVTGVVITGEGDPTVGLLDDGAQWAAEIARVLVEAGVREVRGGVRWESTDPRWQHRETPQGWQSEDLAECYGARAQAFNWGLNCGVFRIQPTRVGAWTTPGVSTLANPVELEIAAGKVTELKVTLEDGVLWIRGTWARKRGLDVVLPLMSAVEPMDAALRDALTVRGVKWVDISEPIIGEPRILTVYSPRLADIFVPMMKHSHNLVSEALWKTLGEKFGDGGARTLTGAGVEVMSRFVSTIGTPSAIAAGDEPVPDYFSGGVRLWDGSGISRDNQVTIDSMMALLMDLRLRPDFGSIWESLPIAGVDGTLRGRMQGTPAEGFLRGKTGTLRGVYNLSGYVPRVSATRPSDFVPFVLLTDTTSDRRVDARLTEDRVGAKLAEVVRR